MRSARAQRNWLVSEQAPNRFWVAGVLSVLLHLLLSWGVSHWKLPEPEPKDEVLRIAFLAKGDQPGDKESSPERSEESAEEQSPSKPKTAQPRPQGAAPSPAPAPDGLFPALPRVGDPLPQPIDFGQQPQTYAQYNEQRMAKFMPSKLKDGGGDPNGDAAITSEGRDKCEPFPGRRLQRVYLLFDSSGSMSDKLEAQALSCAQQYAEAAIDSGASVVVGNFAASVKFSEPTRNMTDVALALRATNDPTATFLPSRELNPFLEAEPGARSDLVILSDGYIPNYREVLSWYRYFLELNPENRGYLYTLGTPGHPEVTAALRDIGFDVYIYRIF